jgi:hypothetical protein
VIPFLPIEQKRDVISSCFDQLMAIESVIDRSHALSSLAPHLTGKLAHTALTIALDIENDNQTYIITGLLPGLDFEAKRELLTKKTDFSPTRSGWHFTRAFVEVLTEDELRQALDNARLLEPEHRAPLLGEIYSKLPDKFIGDAFHELCGLVESHNGLQSLLTLLPRLDQLQLQQTVELILTTKEHFFTSRSGALLRIIPLLHGAYKMEIIRKVIAIASRDKSPDYFYNYTLLPLIPHITPEVLSDFLALIADVPSAQYRAKTLTALYRQMPDHPEMLSMVRKEILQHLRDIQAASRSRLLRFLANSDLFVSAIVPENFLLGIANQIFEICQEWQWL